jgi:hypothetical protein
LNLGFGPSRMTEKEKNTNGKKGKYKKEREKRKGLN